MPAKRIPLSFGYHAEHSDRKGHLHEVYTTAGELYGYERIYVGSLMKGAVEDFALAERRRAGLAAAVCLCMNDRGLTDMETIKRAWFYCETGRDEPVGSKTWEQLRVMAREENDCE